MANEMIIKKCVTAATLQHKFNSMLGDTFWVTDPERNFVVAQAAEATEWLDHMGWKWWKHTTPDFAQAQMEIVDIFHFLLSQAIQEFYVEMDDKEMAIEFAISDAARAVGRVLINCDANIAEDMPAPAPHIVRRDYEAFMTSLFAGYNKKVCHQAVRLMQLAYLCGLSVDNLLSGYIGKNALNLFRQNNGYADGTYRKHWFDGREDNEHLTDILATGACDLTVIQGRLKELYERV